MLTLPNSAPEALKNTTLETREELYALYRSLYAKKYGSDAYETPSHITLDDLTPEQISEDFLVDLAKLYAQASQDTDSTNTSYAHYLDSYYSAIAS